MSEDCQNNGKSILYMQMASFGTTWLRLLRQTFESFLGFLDRFIESTDSMIAYYHMPNTLDNSIHRKCTLSDPLFHIAQYNNVCISDVWMYMRFLKGKSTCCLLPCLRCAYTGVRRHLQKVHGSRLEAAWGGSQLIHDKKFNGAFKDKVNLIGFLWDYLSVPCSLPPLKVQVV